jgi:hypothetical protein
MSKCNKKGMATLLLIFSIGCYILFQTGCASILELTSTQPDLRKIPDSKLVEEDRSILLMHGYIIDKRQQGYIKPEHGYPLAIVDATDNWGGMAVYFMSKTGSGLLLEEKEIDGVWYKEDVRVLKVRASKVKEFICVRFSESFSRSIYRYEIQDTKFYVAPTSLMYFGVFTLELFPDNMYKFYLTYDKKVFDKDLELFRKEYPELFERFKESIVVAVPE